jgi:GT2 family glycosyltransferase
MSSTFSVVVVSLRRPTQLRTCLKTLTACNPVPREVIVVDGDENCSARSVAEEIGRVAPFPIRYLSSSPGITHQRNVGLAAATGDVVVFLDDDARTTEDAFAVLADTYVELDVVGATGRIIEPVDRRHGATGSTLRRILIRGPEGTFTSFGYPRRYIPGDREFDVEFMPGCFMSARRVDAEAVGFDEHLTGYALAEDEDFSCRLARRGRVRFVPSLTVWHDGEGFAGRDDLAFNRSVVVNRYYLFRKNFPHSIRGDVGFVTMVIALVAHRMLNRDWMGARGLVSGALEVVGHH